MRFKYYTIIILNKHYQNYVKSCYRIYKPDGTQLSMYWTTRWKDWINKEDIYINQERVNWGIICYVLSVKSLDCCALCDQGKNKTYNLPVWIVFHTTSSSCNHVHDVAVVQHQCFNSDMIRCKDRLEMFQYILKPFPRRYSDNLQIHHNGSYKYCFQHSFVHTHTN